MTKLSTGPNSLGPVPRAPSPRPPLGHRSPLPLASAPPLRAACRLFHLPRPPAPAMIGPSRCPICRHLLLSPGRAHHRSPIPSRSASSRVTSTWTEIALTYSRSGRRFWARFSFFFMTFQGKWASEPHRRPLALSTAPWLLWRSWPLEKVALPSLLTFGLFQKRGFYQKETDGKQIVEFLINEMPSRWHQRRLLASELAGNKVAAGRLQRAVGNGQAAIGVFYHQSV